MLFQGLLAPVQGEMCKQTFNLYLLGDSLTNTYLKPISISSILHLKMIYLKITYPAVLWHAKA